MWLILVSINSLPIMLNEKMSLCVSDGVTLSIPLEQNIKHFATKNKSHNLMLPSIR